jgi:hypothetical protein
VPRINNRKNAQIFNQKIDKYNRVVDKALKDLARDLIIYLNEYIIEKTPVRSGTARNSFKGAIGGRDLTEPEILPDPRKDFTPDIRGITQRAISRNRSIFEKWNGEGLATITSTLYYILYLENGTAKIKPNAMVETAKIAANAIIETLGQQAAIKIDKYEKSGE